MTEYPNANPLDLVGKNMLDALDGIDLPSYVIDRDGTLRWANHATSTLIGGRVGQSFLNFLPADVRERVCGGTSTVYELAVDDRDGRRVELRVRAAPLRRDEREIVGIFGLATPVRGTPRRTADARPLTPRQAEVLHLLSEGLSTEAVASRLGVARETARNHIRAVLARLDVHTRLEAVVEARQRGLLDD